MFFLLSILYFLMFGPCNVNECVKISCWKCIDCNNVPFCSDHMDHVKFHFRRCQFDKCKVFISHEQSLGINDECFQSKFAYCSRAGCFKKQFIFCDTHSAHDKYHTRKVPSRGYKFVLEGREVVGAQKMFLCKTSSIVGKGFILNKTSRKGNGGITVSLGSSPLKRSASIVDTMGNVSRQLKKSNVSSLVKSATGLLVVNAESENVRKDYICEYCNHQVRSYHSTREAGLNLHWRKNCSIVSGTELVKSLTECFKNVSRHKFVEVECRGDFPSSFFEKRHTLKTSLIEESCDNLVSNHNRLRNLVMFLLVFWFYLIFLCFTVLVCFNFH